MDRRTWLQRLALLPLWGVYFWWLRTLLLAWPRADLIRSLSVLAGAACLYGAAVLVWIGHNKRLARRGERRQAREAKADFSRDVLGRAVVAPPAVLRAQRIVIEVRGGRKYYLPPETKPAAEPDYAGMHSTH